MRKVLTVLAASSLLFGLASCGGSGRRSFVRIVHASPDAGNIDVTINGTKVVSGAAYGTGSNYFTVAPGTNIDLKITQTTTATGSLVDTKIGLIDKTYYTIAVVGVVTPPSTVTILQSTDDHSAPASGDVKIRVLQADPNFHVNPGDSGPVDAYVTAPATSLNNTPPTFPTVSFQTMTAFASVTVPSDGNLEIRVAPGGDTNPDADSLQGWDSQTVLFKAGQVRTYVLLNNPTGTPFPNQSIMLNDLN